MSWHYLQGQEEASWADTFLDGAPSALLSMLPTPGASCLPDNGTECSHGSPFGMTLQRSTGTHGEVELMWFRAGSPVRTYRSLERERDLVESEADCGPKWPGSLARYNPGSRSWRTAQCSLLGGLELYSATFPRWGTLRNGELWERTMPVLRIEETGSGSWPTPTANERDGRDLDKRLRDGRQMGLGEVVRMRTANTPSGNWPTPTCSDAFTDYLKSSQQKEDSMHSVNLSQAVKMWPTPRANKVEGYSSERFRPTLAQEVTGEDKPIGGQLNPDWVEMLMGWPKTWTALEPMSEFHYLSWLMGCSHDENRRDTEALRMLRKGNDATELRKAATGYEHISEATLLLTELREHANRPNEARVFVEGAETPEGIMRILRI